MDEDPRHPVSIDRWDADRITLSVVIDAAPEALWRVLTDPECLARWWRPGVILEAKKGGRFEEPWTAMDGTPQRTTGQVQAVVAPEVLLFSWADADWPVETQVELSLLSAAASGVQGAGNPSTLLELSHDGFLPITTQLGDEILGAHVIGWRRHLRRLKRYAETAEVLDDEPE